MDSSKPWQKGPKLSPSPERPPESLAAHLPYVGDQPRSTDAFPLSLSNQVIALYGKR